jgi:hypothetical protein
MCPGKLTSLGRPQSATSILQINLREYVRSMGRPSGRVEQLAKEVQQSAKHARLPESRREPVVDMTREARRSGDRIARPNRCSVNRKSRSVYSRSQHDVCQFSTLRPLRGEGR